MNTDLTTAGNDKAVQATEETQPAKQPLKLTVDIQSIGACQRHVSVSISREDIDRYFQKQFDELAPKAEVPGFRPGRAPRKLLENKFRRQVSDQVKGALMMDALSQMAEEQRFAAIDEPELNYESVKIPDEGPLTFEFNIEVRPDFELPNWKGLEIEVNDIEVSDDDVNEVIQHYQEQFSDLAPVEGPAQAGDSITCNLLISHQGETIKAMEEVAFNVFPTVSFHDGEINGFDELMIGATAGSTREAEAKVTVVDDQGLETEKTVLVEFEILDVKRRQPISEKELAARMSFDSIEAMRSSLRDAITRRKEYERRQAIRSKISSLLTESAKWDLPPSLLKRQSRREIERALIELHSSGFSDEEIARQENILRRNAVRRTEIALKEHFILERIAEVEKIEDTPEDYDVEIARLARSTGESERRIRSKLERSGQMDALRNMIIEQKVIDLITRHAVFRTIPKQAARASQAEKETPKVYAAPFALWSPPESDIPEARYEDKPKTSIPGQMTTGKAKSSDR